MTSLERERVSEHLSGIYARIVLRESALVGIGRRQRNNLLRSVQPGAPGQASVGQSDS
jgi:hypothetical protein